MARISFACPDWEAKLSRGETPVADLPLDKDKAEAALAIFNSLRLPDQSGHPAMAEASGEWFRDIVRYAFAASDPETGAALVNEVFALVPKKNSKTTYAAALGLTALLLGVMPNRQMLILGPTQNVADRCFDQAHGMIKADPLLRKVFHVQAHKKEITRIKTGTVLSVKTFDMDVVTGEIPDLTIIDELHIVSAKSYAERVIAQITGGMVTNASALLVYITTQSDVPPRGVFKTKLDYARGVRDGRIKDGVRMLPVLYEFPVAVQAAKDKPWRDPALWPMVLPNLGLSVQMDLLRDQYLARKEEGIEAEIIWASQHLNIEIGVGLHGDMWPGAVFWEAAAYLPDDLLPELTLPALIAAGEVAVVGIDGGGFDDLAALTVLVRLKTRPVWVQWTKVWAYPEVFERRKDIASRLRDFERQGDLVVCDEADRDLIEMAGICLDLIAAGLLPEKEAIGYDRHSGLANLLEVFERMGVPGDMMIGIEQAWKLQPAITGLPRALKHGTVKHCGQPVMAWSVGNAKQELRGSNYVITKQAAGSAKIDPLVALLDAGMLMFRNPVPAESVQPRVRAL
jgi:phage terminase large subunit-like protein